MTRPFPCAIFLAYSSWAGLTGLVSSFPAVSPSALDAPAPGRSVLAERREVIDRTRATAASRSPPAHPARAREMERPTEPHDADEDPARLIDANIAALG